MAKKAAKRLTKADREFVEHVNEMSDRDAENMSDVSIGGVRLAVKPAVKKIPQPKLPKDWGKVKPATFYATCSNPHFAEMGDSRWDQYFDAAIAKQNGLSRPIRDVAADIQKLVIRADGLIARWEEITLAVESVCDYMEKILARKAKP